MTTTTKHPQSGPLTHASVSVGAVQFSVFTYDKGPPDVTMQIYGADGLSVGLPGFTPAQARDIARLLNACADEVEALLSATPAPTREPSGDSGESGEVVA